jgi:pimeloyl-ACP methyl ester carboxylesterase
VRRPGPTLLLGLWLLLVAAGKAQAQPVDPCQPLERNLPGRTEATGCIFVPLERHEAHGAFIPIYFVHSIPDGPAYGRVLMYHGGPAVPTRGIPDQGPFFGALARSMEILYFHQRGAGFSARLEELPADHLRDDYSLDDSVDDALTLMDRFWPGVGDIVVFGKSAGGFLALKTALRRPDRVRALVLLATAGDHRYMSQRDQARAEYEALMEARYPGFGELLNKARARFGREGISGLPRGSTWLDFEDIYLFKLAYTYQGQERIPALLRAFVAGDEGPLRELVDSRTLPGFGRLGSRSAFLLAACRELGMEEVFPRDCAGIPPGPSRFDVLADLRRISVPVLLLSGAFDPVVPPSRQRALAEALGARVTHLWLPRASHLLLEDQPQEAAAALLDFLGLCRPRD